MARKLKELKKESANNSKINKNEPKTHDTT